MGADFYYNYQKLASSSLLSDYASNNIIALRYEHIQQDWNTLFSINDNNKMISFLGYINNNNKLIESSLNQQDLKLDLLFKSSDYSDSSTNNKYYNNVSNEGRSILCKYLLNEITSHVNMLHYSININYCKDI